MAVFSGNGSNTAPSFTFSSDTDSGLYRIGDNELGVTVGGSNKITINSTGIGIGTGPSVPFEVDGDVRLSVGSGGTLTAFESDGTRRNRAIIGADVNGAFIRSTFSSGGTAALNIIYGSTTGAQFSNTGNLLVGGTLPSAPNAQITSAGRGYFKDRVTTGAGNAVFAGTATNRYEEIPASTAKTFTITNPCVLGGVLRFNGGFYVNASNGFGIISLVVYGDSTSTGNYTIVEEYNTVSGSVGAITVTKSAGSLSFNVTNNNAAQAMFFNWSALYSGDTAAAKQISFAIA